MKMVENETEYLVDPSASMCDDQEILHEFFDSCAMPNPEELNLLGKITGQPAIKVLEWFIVQRSKIQHLELRRALITNSATEKKLEEQLNEHRVAE